MQIINSLDNINEILGSLIESDEYTSIAYVPILNSITAYDIITIKKAQKLLDAIVVTNISNQNFDNLTISTLKQLDINLAIDYLEEEINEQDIRISFANQSINSMNLMRSLLAILPSSVFVSSENFETFKTISIINKTFKDLFTLNDIATPESLKSFEELEVIKTLQNFAKSKQAVNKLNIINCLSEFDVSAYQEFKINDKLYVNMKIKHDNSYLNISFTFDL